MPSPNWRRPSRARWWPRPMPATTLSFGPEYLIPKPFDPRLMMKIAPAVAQAAADFGRGAAADRRLGRLPREAAELRLRLGHDDEADLRAGQAAPRRKRVAYAEGEEERVLRAVQVVVDEGLARPTLIGRPAVIAARIEKFGLRLKQGARLRRRQRRARRALPRLLADLPPHDRAQGRDGAGGQDRDAPAPDADRRDAAAQGRGRRHALRHLGHHRQRTCTTSTR